MAPLTIFQTMIRFPNQESFQINAMMRQTALRKLKEKGLKITPQRLAVIEALAATRDLHPGAGAVYREAKKRHGNLSLSTTYAALKELSAHGIIKTLQFDTAENRYEVNNDEHVNLICNDCGKIFDYEVSTPADPGEVEKRTGFSVAGTRLEYYGYCKECRKRKRVDTTRGGKRHG